MSDLHHSKHERELNLSYEKVDGLFDEGSCSIVYKFLLSHITSPVLVCDENGLIVFCNKNLESLSGYSIEECKGRKALEFIPKKYHLTVFAEHDKRQRGHSTVFNLEFKTKNDAFIPVKIHSYPLPNGASISLITDLRNVLKQTNIYELALENLDNPVWISDINDKCIYANPSMCQLLGYELSELYTLTSVDVTAGHSVEIVSNEVEKRRNGIFGIYTCDLLTKSGELVSVRIDSNPIPNGGSISLITDLKNERMEEVQYKYLVENMNEAVFLRSKDGVLLLANKQLCNLVGYTHDELIGEKTFKYWSDDSIEKVKQEDMKRRLGESSVYKAVIKTKANGLIPVLVSASPTLEGGSFGIITDIRDIVAKDTVFNDLVEHMNEAVWLGDENEKTKYVNPMFCQLTGYSEDEIMNMRSYDFLDDSCKHLIDDEKSNRIQGISNQYEAKIKSKNGDIIPVIVSGAPTYDKGTIAILTDISEIKKRDTEIATKEHYLATVNNSSADAIISTAIDGTILSWNKGAEKMFGFTESEIINKSHLLYTPHERRDRGEVEQINREVQKKGFVRDFRTQRKHKDGFLVDVALTKSSIKSAADEVVGYCTVYRDISLQKKWEDELNLRFENLKNAYIELGRKGRHMDYYVDLLDIIVGDIDVNKTFDFIIGATAMITKVDACTLRTYNKNTDLLELRATNGVTAEWYSKGSIVYKGSLAEQAFKERKPKQILNLYEDNAYKSQKLAMKHNLHSLLLIPLYVKDEFLGTLSLYISRSSKFELLDNEFIEHFAKIVSIALKLEQ